MADHIYFPQVGGRGGLRKGGGGLRWPFGKSLEGKERIEVIMGRVMICLAIFLCHYEAILIHLVVVY